MTEEIKKLVESVPTCDFKFDEYPELDGNYVLKSDFMRVVEELTKWNKVEDSFPVIGVKVLVLLSTGNWSTSQRYISTGSGIEQWKGSGTFTDSITEWKYIN